MILGKNRTCHLFDYTHWVLVACQPSLGFCWLCFSQMIPFGFGRITLWRRSHWWGAKIYSVQTPVASSSSSQKDGGGSYLSRMRKSLYLRFVCICQEVTEDWSLGQTWSRYNFIVINWFLGRRQFGTGSLLKVNYRTIEAKTCSERNLSTLLSITDINYCPI